MSNKKLGLALGAGSAKGLAHLGVLQVLEENDITVDCIAGTSMGAVLGGIYACGTDLNLLVKFAGEFSEKPFLDISIPRRGLVRGIRFQELIKLLTKDYDFTKLRIPFAAVACDLKRGQTVTFSEGSIKLHDAIRASLAIPGVFHPFTIDGVDYVDGGVIDRVPVQTARDLGADVVLAVDVGYKGEGERPMGNIIEVLMSAFDVMGWEIARHKVNTADILISPDVSFVNRMTTTQAAETIQAGRNAMEAELERLKSLIGD